MHSLNFELHYKLCWVPVYVCGPDSNLRSNVPDRNLRKLVNPKESGPTKHLHCNWDSGIILANSQHLVMLERNHHDEWPA